MHAVLDEDPAALGPVPEPVVRPEPFVAGIVLERSAQHVAEKLRVHERFDLPEERVVALHQVGDEEAPLVSRDGHELVGLLHRDRQRLLDDDVLTGVKSVSRLLVVEKWRGGDVDELHIGHREQHLRAFHVRKTEPRGAGERRFATGACNAPQRGPGTCANCCAANMAKPPKPRMPMPTVFADMRCVTLSEPRRREPGRLRAPALGLDQGYRPFKTWKEAEAAEVAVAGVGEARPRRRHAFSLSAF